MEKKTIGNFIAVLRKSRGMTQQELAQRLNVSNKTVSKWERDESYPEITLIPVIAEIFEVTSDEILKGERINKEEAASNKSNTKTEKQIMRMLDSSLTKFKSITMVAIALALTGFILFFTIVYAFYRPIIGIGVLLVFAIVSILLEAIQLNMSNASLQSNELLSENRNTFIAIRNKKYKYAIHVFNINAILIIFTLPYIFNPNTYAYYQSIILWEEYVIRLPYLIVFAAISCFVSMQIYGSVTRSSLSGADTLITLPERKMKQMNRLHLCLTLCLALIICITNFHVESRLSSTNYHIGGPLLPVLIYGSIIIVFFVQGNGRKEKTLLLLAGIRNLFCGLMAVYLLVLTLKRAKYIAFVPYMPPLYILLFLSIISIAGYLLMRIKLRTED